MLAFCETTEQEELSLYFADRGAPIVFTTEGTWGLCVSAALHTLAVTGMAQV